MYVVQPVDSRVTEQRTIGWKLISSVVIFSYKRNTEQMIYLLPGIYAWPNKNP